MPEEAFLLKASKTGKPDTFASLFETYADHLYRRLGCFLQRVVRLFSFQLARLPFRQISQIDWMVFSVQARWKALTTCGSNWIPASPTISR